MNNQQGAKKEEKSWQPGERNQQNSADSDKNDKDQPHIMPSETDNDEVSSATNKAGDPGRTPGKAEGGEI